MKVTVVGAGMVGSTFAYRLLLSGMASEIVLIDVNRERAEGEAEDMNHAASVEMPVLVRAGDYPDAAGSDFVVITAGLSNLKDGTRLDLCNKNAEIFKDIVPKLAQQAPNACYIVASNPADVMTYATIKYSGLDPKRIIGSGTVLDSSRLRFLLSQKIGVSPTQISAYSLGEHGDSQTPIYSQVSVRGIALPSFLHQIGKEFTDQEKVEMTDLVRTAAYRIISRKNATYYGIGSALLRIMRAVYRDEHVILPVSCLAQGEYDITDTCLALPALVNKNGIQQIFDLSLSQQEYADLLKSAAQLKEYTSQLPA